MASWRVPGIQIRISTLRYRNNETKYIRYFDRGNLCFRNLEIFQDCINDDNQYCIITEIDGCNTRKVAEREKEKRQS